MSIYEINDLLRISRKNMLFYINLAVFEGRPLQDKNKLKDNEADMS